MDAMEALSELRYLELELSDVMDSAVPRVSDRETADGVRMIAEQHRRHAGQAAEALQRMDAADAQPDARFSEHVRATEREVLHASDEGGLLNGLADVERYDLRLHEHVLAAADVPAEVAELVERQTEVERTVVDFLELVAPDAGYEVGGVRFMPGGRARVE